MKNLNAKAAERAGDAKRGLKLHTTKWRQAALTLLSGDVETENRVLMVEALHANLIYVVKAKCCERVMPEDVISARVHLQGKLPEMNLGREDRERVSLCVWINVAAPEAELDDLGIVEGWPIAEDARESLTAFDKFFGFIHEIREQRLTFRISEPAPGDIQNATETRSRASLHSVG
jgi:hypothetical protein